MYKGHVYFEPVRPYFIYQALAYLKSRNMFCEDIDIAKRLSNEDMLRFSNIIETQRQNENFIIKLFLIEEK